MRTGEAGVEVGLRPALILAYCTEKTTVFIYAYQVGCTWQMDRLLMFRMHNSDTAFREESELRGP